MKQYNQIKSKYPDALLLFRVGDFYETFGEDAIKAANILGIVLTKRGAGSNSETEKWFQGKWGKGLIKRGEMVYSDPFTIQLLSPILFHSSQNLPPKPTSLASQGEQKKK